MIQVAALDSPSAGSSGELSASMRERNQRIIGKSHSLEPHRRSLDGNYTNATKRHQKAFADKFPYARVTEAEEAHESDGGDVVVVNQYVEDQASA